MSLPMQHSFLGTSQLDMTIANSTSVRMFSTDAPKDKKQEMNDDLQVWSNLNQEGMGYLRTGDPDQLNNAERCFREASNLMSKYPMMPYRSLSLANLGSSLVRKGRYNDAINMFRPLLLELPMFTQVSLAQIATVHMELASAYEHVGDPTNASRELSVASSRFISGANVYLKQIHAIDNVHDQTVTATPQQRTHLIVNAVSAWKAALGCRYTSAVILYKKGEWEESESQLQKILSVYQYMIQCVDICIANPDKSATELANLFPVCPQEAVVVTSQLVFLLQGLDAKYLEDLTKQATSDITNVLRSIASVNLDLQNVSGACDAFHEASRLTLKGNMDNFMNVASEAARTLTVVHEKLEHELNTASFDDKGNRIGGDKVEPVESDGDSRSVVFRHRKRSGVERGLKAIEKSRVIMGKLFVEFEQKRSARAAAHLEELKKADTAELAKSMGMSPEVAKAFDESFERIYLNAVEDEKNGISKNSDEWSEEHIKVVLARREYESQQIAKAREATRVREAREKAEAEAAGLSAESAEGAEKAAEVEGDKKTDDAKSSSTSESQPQAQ